MKKFFYIFILQVFLATSVHAYNSSGRPTMIFSGYKMARKVPVHGVFKNFDFKATSGANFEDFLLSMQATMHGMSFDTKMTTRDNAIVQTLFRLGDTQKIHARVASVRGDDKSGELSLAVTWNKIKKTVKLQYSVNNNTINMVGKTDILDYNMRMQFEAFKKRCRGFHGGKSWSEVGINISIPFLN